MPEAPHLVPSAAWRQVHTVAGRASIAGPVSPRGLRRARARHALERGAPVGLLRDRLGQGSVGTTNGSLRPWPKDGTARYLAVQADAERSRNLIDTWPVRT